MTEPLANVSVCPACGGTVTREFARGAGRYRVVVCEDCGLGRTVPQPEDAELRALYGGDYGGADARKFSGAIEAARRLLVRGLARRIVRRAGPGGRVLDVGCGDGKLIAALMAQGYECSGTEYNPRVRETAPAGAVIHVGALEELRLPTHSQRIVVMRHVLEHVRDPAATLREVHRILEPNGWLVIGVPNLASWQARWARDGWFHLDLPRHLHHFTPRALTQLLDRSGFTTTHVSHWSIEQNPYGWLQSALNAAGGRLAGLYDQLRSMGATGARTPDPLTLAVAGLLTPLSFVAATVESASHAGGTIEVWARPR